MDGDTRDTPTDALNGESKPDPAELAQTAIIKQVSDAHWGKLAPFLHAHFHNFATS